MRSPDVVIIIIICQPGSREDSKAQLTLARRLDVAGWRSLIHNNYTSGSI